MNVGGASLPPYLWSFVMLFVYRCKREYYLSEFKFLFIIYGALTVSKTKQIINNSPPSVKPWWLQLQLVYQSQQWKQYHLKSVWLTLFILQFVQFLFLGFLGFEHKEPKLLIFLFILLCFLTYLTPLKCPVFKEF